MTKNKPQHRIVWTDINVKDLQRAISFYSYILGYELEEVRHGEMSFVPLSLDDDEVAGCLVQVDDFKPADGSILIYLSVEGRMDEIASSIKQHGGKLLEPKTQIGPWGHRAVILDSEGNKIALHSFT